MSREPKFLRALRDRPVKQLYRGWIQEEWCSNLTLWNRIKILFGRKLVLLIGIATELHPGKHHPIIWAKVSKSTTAGDYMRELMTRQFSPIEQADPKRPKE